MRREDFDTSYLQNYRLIHRTLCAVNELHTADLDLLIYLNPIEYFTQQDFKDGTFTMSWDKKRFYRLVNDGWIKKIYEGRGMLGGHNKYVLTHKSKVLINRMGKIIDGREDLPNIRNKDTYSKKILSMAINKFNNNKYNDYEKGT